MKVKTNISKTKNRRSKTSQSLRSPKQKRVKIGAVNNMRDGLFRVGVLMLFFAVAISATVVMSSRSQDNSGLGPEKAKAVAIQHMESFVECDFTDFALSQGYSPEGYESLYSTEAQTAESKFLEMCADFVQANYLGIELQDKEDRISLGDDYQGDSYIVYFRVVTESQRDEKTVVGLAVYQRFDKEMVAMPVASHTMTPTEYNSKLR